MASWDSKWRFDPAKGGVYDSSKDDEDKPDVPAIAADTTAMPDAAPMTTAVGAGGVSPAASAPTTPPPATPAATGETFGIPNTTTPLTLTGDTSHTNVSRKVTTAQDAIAQGAIANAAEEQAGALRTQGELEAKQKLDEAGTHDKREDVYKVNNKLRETAIQETEAQKKALADKAAALQKTIDGTTITDGWSDKTLGHRLLVSLALIVNGIGRGLAGDHGPDQLFASVQEKIKHDHDEQVRKLDKMRADFIHLTGPAREAAEKELKTRLENIDAVQIGQLNRVAEEGNALAARNGSPLVIAKMGEKMAEVKAKAAEKQQDFLDKTRTEIQSGSAHESKQVQPTGAAGGKPTDAEEKMALYGRQMKDALKTMESVPPLSQESLAKVQDRMSKFEAAEKTAASGVKGAFVTGVARWAGALPRSLYEGLTPQEQIALNAAHTYVNAAMRTESGAAIGVDENRAGFFRMMPVAGETPEVQAMKLQEAHRKAEDYATLGGAATTKLQAAGSSAPALAAVPGSRAPAPVKHADVSADLAKVQKRIDSMKPGDPERARWEAVRDHLKGGQ
jgi:hypothetical protein